MSQAKPLMPKATAVWLVENTALTFEQIAELCQLHMLEVKGIADGDVAQGIRGKDPITGGELTREEIRKGEADPGYRLKLSKSNVVLPPTKAKKPARYTPTSRRQDRPNAILWLVRNHPELKDAQIIKLVGTTKPTILQIRERTHWNSTNLLPQDPVTLGLCSQLDLDNEVQKAAARIKKELEERGEVFDAAGHTLVPAEDTTGYVPGSPSDPNAEQPRIDLDDGAPSGRPKETEEERVFAKLQRMSSAVPAEDEPQPDIDDVFRAAAAEPDADGDSADDAGATDDQQSAETDDGHDTVEVDAEGHPSGIDDTGATGDADASR